MLDVHSWIKLQPYTKQVIIHAVYKSETQKGKPINFLQTIAPTHVIHLSARFQAPGFTQLTGILAENIPDAAKVMREEMDHNLADSIPAFRKEDHTFLSVLGTWSWELRIMCEEGKFVHDWD